MVDAAVAYHGVEARRGPPLQSVNRIASASSVSIAPIGCGFLFSLSVIRSVVSDGPVISLMLVSHLDVLVRRAGVVARR